MSIWDGFRNRLGSGDAKEKQSSPPTASAPASSSRGGQDVEWNSNLERKLKGVLHQLKVLTKIRKTRIPSPASTTSASPPTTDAALPASATSSTATPAAAAAQAAAAAAADPAVEAQSKRVGDAVKEVLPALALPSFSYDTRGRGSHHHHLSEGGSSSGLSAARRFFLDLWHLLMINLEALEGKHQKHAYEAISYLITREEFDLTRMGLHLDGLRCSKDELLVVHRYRVLLFHTQTFISVKLSEVVERPHTPPYYFSQFCARVLAVTFFRLPGVSRALVQAVALSTPQLAELEAYLIPLQRPPAAVRLPIGDHRPVPSSSSTPSSSSSSPPPSSPPMSFVSPSSTVRSGSPAIRIGATKADGGAASPKHAAAAELKLGQQERRVDSPRIEARQLDSDSSPRRGAEEERERGEKEETKQKRKKKRGDDDDNDDKERHEHESEEEAEENEGDENGNENENGDSAGGSAGDGRSARKYTFTQGRCYWLVTQLDGGQKAAKRKVTGPVAVSPTLSRNTLSAFPNLTTWHTFHGALLMRIADNEDDKLRLAPTEWLKLFNQRDRLYFLFLRDWVDHILYNTQGRPLEWSGVKGYIPFLLGFIYELRARKHLTKPLLDCTNAFLTTDPSLLNLFVKLTFTRTKLYDPMAVADALSCLEAWLEQFRADDRQVPPSFDHAFLVESLELILSTEHHQLLLKVLMFLYQYSEVFMGDARIALYSDFVLDRHFYYFFLHWDINVRNAFHQLLAYKMLRTKRSHLQGQGLRVKELASVGNNGSGSNGNSPNSRRPQAASTLIDREQAVDVMLLEKMEDKLKTAGNQMRGLVRDCYPAGWEVYVPVALTEYKRYMAQYYQWEGSDKKQPRMMPVAMVERTPPPVPILAQPRPRASMDGPDT